jgi:multimeric flavodoxin WrbA
MKIIIINGSLKKQSESNTFAVCQLMDSKFRSLGAESRIVTLNEIDYECGTDKYDDDLQPVLNEMLKSDGIVFATPIWWGMYSSLIQSLVERMDYIDTWSTENGFRPFYNKVFGAAVSGGSDGFQNIHGTLFSFANNLGFTIPPMSNLESFAQENVAKDEDTLKQVDRFCTNMFVYGSMIKAGNPTRFGLHEDKQ